MPMFSFNSSVQSFFRTFLISLAGLLLLQQCRSKAGQHHASGISGDTSQSVQAENIEYARGFSIKKHPHYTVINVFNPFQNSADTLRYMLVPRNQPLPQKAGRIPVIRTPIRSMIATSTTHIALTEMLDANQIVKGMVGAKYVYSKEIRERLDDGKITPFNQGEFNDEVALEMHPDVVMISAGQTSQYDRYKLLQKSGIVVFVNAEWLETTPLGKAEWLKVMGALLDKENVADNHFKEVVNKYNRLKQKVKNAAKKPLVINNMPYKDAWFVPGGHSFTAQYLKDAGAAYPWFDNESTGGLHLSYETVYEAGLRADVWLNPGTAHSRQDILATDSRLSKFKSFKNDQIYNDNKRLSPEGGNDFWETGVVRPDLVLSDLITIFHPQLMKSDSLYFYQKVK